MPPPDQRRVIEQAKFSYYPLRKAFQKQTKTIEEQVKSKYMPLQIKMKEKRFQPIKMIIKVFTKKYLVNWLRKNLMK